MSKILSTSNAFYPFFYLFHLYLRNIFRMNIDYSWSCHANNYWSNHYRMFKHSGYEISG